MTLRLLTIAHSYCVTSNRRLANEMARAGGGRWSVTAVAPDKFPGDLWPVVTAADPNELANLVTVPVHMASIAHVMFYGRSLRTLLREPWDVVHCWEEPYILAGAQVAKWASPASRLVFSTFQNIDKQYPPPFGALERYSLSRASGWIAFGHTVKQALSRRDAYANVPHRVITPGVDIERFAPDPASGLATRRALGWQDDAIPTIGFLGRFVPQKGLTLLMRVLDQLRHPWRALIIGGGPLESQLRSWAARHPGQVHILTGITHDDVPRHLAAMDVLCAPTQTTPQWREQFGRMLIEAFAAGVPVVASDSGEIPHVLATAGRVVPENDETAWVTALDDVLANKAERDRMRARGLARARSEFSWPVISGRYISFFDDLMTVPPRATSSAHS